MWQTDCGNGIAEIGKEKLWQTDCGNAIAKIGKKKIVTNWLWQWHCRNRKKKLWQTDCGNDIIEIGKKIVIIMAMALPKMGKKKVVPKSGEE